MDLIVWAFDLQALETIEALPAGFIGTLGKSARGRDIRADLINWTVKQENPIITVDTGDIYEWGAGDEATHVYPAGVRHYRGKW